MSNFDWGGSNNSIDNPNKDVIVNSPPNDSISCMRFSPTNEQFVLTSWNNNINLYEYKISNNSINTRQKTSQKHNKPALTCCYDHSGENIFSGGTDNILYRWDLKKNVQMNICNYHKAAIKEISYVKEKSCIITGSWDKKCTFWDLRQGGKKAMEINNLNQKIYCMCNKGSLLVIGLSNGHVRWYDIRQGNNHIKDKTTPLKHQLRCMDAFPKMKGFAVASVEGRTAIEYCDPTKYTKNFSFKCHRQTNSQYSNNSYSDVYCVNALRFHAGFGTFATGGGDGEINIWDKGGRSRLTHLARLKTPIVALDFDRTGKLLGYGTSYDWSKGFNGKPNNHKPQIYLHMLQRKEIDPKAPDSNNN